MENDKTPLFSSDLQYLGRINSLINIAMFEMFETDTNGYYNVLYNLFIQLEPRMNKDEISKLEDMFNDVKNKNYKRSLLNKAFRELNNIAHKKKLILRDQSDGMEATIS